MPQTALTYLRETNPKKDIFLMIENYIYMYHVGQFIVLPAFVDSVTDSQSVSFSQSSILGRSAPIYSYQNSGPRTVQVSFRLHRDLMQQINKDVSNAVVDLGDDYVDTMIKLVQACVVPDYNAADKSVNPPMVALRLGNDIFIKGVLTSGLSLTYGYPILSDGRYATVDISFTVSEVDPYDALTVMRVGSFRMVSSDLDRGEIDTVYNESANWTNSVISNIPDKTNTKDVNDDLVLISLQYGEIPTDTMIGHVWDREAYEDWENSKIVSSNLGGGAGNPPGSIQRADFNADSLV